VGSYDHLYFKETSWNILRDAGIITNEYMLQVNLSKIKSLNKPAIEIYPVRDVR